MFGICKHEFKETDNGESIYCTKCGKIKLIPIQPCQHNFVQVQTLTSANNITHCVNRYIYISRCTKCGIYTNDEFR